MRKIFLICVLCAIVMWADEEPQIYDFAEIAHKEYRGDGETINFLRVKTHDTNYFLPFSYSFGSSDPTRKRAEAKFQISVKKALLENVFGLNEGLYFAYTQTAWWQMYAESAPFRELNYAPELFITFPFYFENFSALKNTGIGFMHQSNGKAGLESRSWNRVYINVLFATNRFVFFPRVWYVIPESSLNENRDIRKYLGNFDIKLAYLGKDTFAYALLRNNLSFKHNRGAIEFNVGFDLLDNGVFWYVQYFNGYGESLIDYQRHMNKFSLGFLIAY